MVASGNMVYFLMMEGGAPCRGGADLWQSDGTPAGTHQAYDFDPSSGIDYVDNGLTALGGVLYLGAVDKDGYDVLWKTNGTESGTRIVKQISPSRDCGTTAMTAVGSRLFFFAWDGTGMALWRTRGTARTTVKVYPIDLPGCAMYSMEPYCFLDETPVAAGSRLFFPAYAKGSGTELWVSDGTTAGTRQVKNIVYGGASSNSVRSGGRRLAALLLGPRREPRPRAVGQRRHGAGHAHGHGYQPRLRHAHGVVSLSSTDDPADRQSPPRDATATIPRG